MTLTSVSFFVLVIASLLVYYIVPLRFRWMVLLTASGCFYAIVCLKYMPFIVITSLTTFLGGLWLNKYSAGRKQYLKDNKADFDAEAKKTFKNVTTRNKRLILSAVLVFNFGILGFLKYYDFFAATIQNVLGIQMAQLSLFLPLGISFYTFQAMGYIIDVYWEKTAPQTNYAKFALFVSFFPQIVQGPIAIYDDLANQLFEGHKLDFFNIKYGAELIIWGLLKKMVIADRVLIAIEAILQDKANLDNTYCLVALLFYMLQLYADFSGGIDIARGVAQMFGINMAENFKRPYFSKTVTEFWHRWHITLGHWLRTYLFYPLVVSKAFMNFGKWISKHGKQNSQENIVKLDKNGNPKTTILDGLTVYQHIGRVLPGSIGTVIVFIIIGIWHGADWKYVGYGLYNGIILFISMMLDPLFKWLVQRLGIRTTRLSWRILQIVRTFVLMTIGSVFDISNGLSDSIEMAIRCIKGIIPNTAFFTNNKLLSFGLTKLDYIVILLGIILIFCVSLYQERSKKIVREELNKEMIWFQWVLIILGVVVIAIFGIYGPGYSASEFVYMQF